MKRLFNPINLFFACCFLVFAGLQYNDPDNWIWIIIYGIAALGCILFHFKRLPSAAVAGYAVIMILLGIYHAWSIVSKHQHFFHEEGREMMGAFLIAIWMVTLFVRSKQINLR